MNFEKRKMRPVFFACIVTFDAPTDGALLAKAAYPM